MTEFTGQNLYVIFDTTVLSGDYRTFDENDEAGMVDASAGSDSRRTYLDTLKDGGATVELLAQEGGTALWAAIEPGTEGTLEWGPEGTVAGKPKHTITAKVKSRKRNVVYEEVTKISVEFVFNDSADIVDDVYP
jgi:hypothetical protein